jgi:PAB-dependent poly(A)-specific ribonuclease subunit 3
MREAFVSKEIEDSPALYFAYDYYPGAVSLEAAHLQQEQSGGVVHLTVSSQMK